MNYYITHYDSPYELKEYLNQDLGIPLSKFTVSTTYGNEMFLDYDLDGYTLTEEQIILVKLKFSEICYYTDETITKVLG